MPTATTHVSASDPNNEDARSTSSTLVNGEHSARNDNDDVRSTTEQQQRHTPTTGVVRHGFDNAAYEDDVLSFLHFSERRHETNAKHNVAVRQVSLDWVTFLYILSCSLLNAWQLTNISLSLLFSVYVKESRLYQVSYAFHEDDDEEVINIGMY